jgi:hypothetical protein
MRNVRNCEMGDGNEKEVEGRMQEVGESHEKVSKVKGEVGGPFLLPLRPTTTNLVRLLRPSLRPGRSSSPPNWIEEKKVRLPRVPSSLPST